MSTTASAKTSKQPARPELPGGFLLLRAAVKIYQTNFSFFFGYAAWILIPLVLSVFARVTLDAETFQFVDAFLDATISFVLNIILSVVFILATTSIFTKHPVTKEIVRYAAILSFPYFLTLVLSGLITASGTILLVIPGIVFGVWFMLAPVVAVLEQKGVMESMRASRNLVRGRFFPVLGRILVGRGMLLLTHLAIVGVILFASFKIQGATNIYDFFAQSPAPAEAVLLRLVGIFFFPLDLIFVTVLYLHLRTRE